MVGVSCIGWLAVASFLPIGNCIAVRVDALVVPKWALWASTGIWVMGRLMGLLWWPYVATSFFSISAVSERAVDDNPRLQQVLFISIYPESKHRTKGMGLSKQIGSLTAFTNSTLFGYVLCNLSSPDQDKLMSAQISVCDIEQVSCRYFGETARSCCSHRFGWSIDDCSREAGGGFERCGTRKPGLETM